MTATMIGRVMTNDCDKKMNGMKRNGGAHMKANGNSVNGKSVKKNALKMRCVKLQLF